ncbi:15736_t:CDS:10, partial [Funneliformis mosseae]
LLEIYFGTIAVLVFKIPGTNKDSLKKDKSQSQYVSELTTIKLSYSEKDEQYKTVTKALENVKVSWFFFMGIGVDHMVKCEHPFVAQWLGLARFQHADVNEKASEEVTNFWEDQNLDQNLSRLHKRRKLVEVEGIVDFLQTGNKRLSDTSRFVHKSQLELLKRNEGNLSRKTSGLASNIDVDSNSAIADVENNPFFVPKYGKNLDKADEDEINQHKQDERSPSCSNCNTEINISGLIRFCPYCGGDIVLSENVSVFEELDYESDGENDTDDRDKEDKTPQNSKLRLRTGKIVEDVLFKFAKDMDYEHHAHSYIVDYDDENVKSLFTDIEWEELTKDRIGVPDVPSEIVKEMAKYGKKTLKELRTIVMTSYLKDDETYDISKHYDKEWIQTAMRALCNLYENMDSPLIRSQYEDWYTVSLFGSCIDFCIRDAQLGTDIKRTDAPSIDGIIYSIDKQFEVGAIEAARSFLGISDRKYLLEAFKMPKTLRDMYTDLLIAANYEQQKADKIQVVGVLHLGLWIQFVKLWRAGGSICIFRKDPRSFNVDSRFSKEGVKSFLKLLIAIYQYKLSIKDNLQVLNILNSNDNESDDDLENQLVEASRSSTPPPASTVEFFTDNVKTPRKLRKKSR